MILSIARLGVAANTGVKDAVAGILAIGGLVMVKRQRSESPA